MHRYSHTAARHGLGLDAREFYDVHVVADAHHGPLAVRDLVGGYLDEQPQDAATLLWGALVLLHVEDRFARLLLDAWSDERSSLRAVDAAAADVQRTDSRSARSSPRIRSVASAMHRWYSRRDWPASWTSVR
jgi:hypothetical protein